MRAALIAFVIVIAVALVALVVMLAIRFRRRDVSVAHDITSIGANTPLHAAHESTEDAQNQTTDAVGTASGRAPVDRIRGRFVAMGVLIAAIFGSLAAKLWSMQVLNASQYMEDSTANQVKTIKTPAARGRVFDAEGIELIGNQVVPTVLADADVADDHNTLTRLSALLGIPYSVVRQRIQDSTGGAQAKRVVTTNPRVRDVAYIAEHPDAFPGISVEDRSSRIYPYGALACQLLGYSGTVSESELENMPEGADYQHGDEVGKSGVEAAFESVLMGSHGERVVVADADGTVHEVVSTTPARQGNDLYLTVSARIQQVAETELIKKIAPYGTIGGGVGTAGAIVAMTVDGDILAMASFPNFNPEHFIGGITQDDWDRYNDESARRPLMNRCIAGSYPAASTFKAFIGMAGLHYGFADSKKSWHCSGKWTGFGEDYAQECWEKEGHGYINFREGIVHSCDVVFYDIAANFYYNREEIGETAMQDYVKKFGFGQRTGVALAGETEGVVPTPEWKKAYYANQPEEGQWVPGDMTNTAIGQGNVLITPLQLAVGYAGVATGRLPKPNLLKEVRNSAGETVVTPEYSYTEIEGVNDKDYATMRDALRGVALEDGDVPETLAKAGDFQCACKTGTGEASGDRDAYSWFVMYAPYDDPKYVVACVIEEGGYGADTAAPVSAPVMQACFDYAEGNLTDQVARIEETSQNIEYVSTGMVRGE